MYLNNGNLLISRLLVYVGVLASLIFLGVSTTIAYAQTTEKGLELPLDDLFGQNRLWDDGKAEVAKYEATRMIYGQAREYELTSILVSEPLLADQLVKADYPYDGKDVVPAFKSHTVEVIPTQNYDYHFATSFFFSRDDLGTPMKAAYAGFEWCGTTFKEFRLAQSPPMVSGE